MLWGFTMAETTGEATELGSAIARVLLDTRELVKGRVQVQLNLSLVQQAFKATQDAINANNSKISQSVRDSTAATTKALRELEKERNADAANLKKATDAAKKEYDQQTKAATDSFKKQVDTFKNVYGKGIRDEAKKLATDMAVLGKSIGSALNTGIMAAGKVVLGAGLGATIFAGKTAIDFESAFNEVKRFVGGSQEELAKLQVDLRALALDPKVGKSFIELTKIASMGGQLGISNKDIIEFTRQVAYVGQAGDASGEQVATGLAKIMSAMQLPMTELPKLSSAIAQMGKEGASKITEIIDTAQRLAGAAREVGLSAPAVLAFSNTVVSLGQEPEAAGTALSRVFQAINKAVHAGGPELARYAAIARVSVATFKKDFVDDAGHAVLEFVTGLDAIPKKTNEVGKNLDALGFTNERIKNSVRNLAAGHEQLAASLDSAKRAAEGHNVAEDMAAVAAQTTKRQMETLKNQIDDVANSFGEQLLPKLNAFIKQAGTPTIDTLRDLNTYLKNAATSSGSLAWFVNQAKKAITDLGEAIRQTIHAAAQDSGRAGLIAAKIQDANELREFADRLEGPISNLGISPEERERGNALSKKYGFDSGSMRLPGDAAKQARAAGDAAAASYKDDIAAINAAVPTRAIKSAALDRLRTPADRFEQTAEMFGIDGGGDGPGGPPNTGGLKSAKEIKDAAAKAAREAKAAEREKERAAEAAARANEQVDEKALKLTLSDYDLRRHMAEKERNEAVRNGADKVNAQRTYYLEIADIAQKEATAQAKSFNEGWAASLKAFKTYTGQIAKVRKDAAEEAAKMTENQFTYELETGAISTGDALRAIDIKLAKEKKFTDEWMRLQQLRRTVEQMDNRARNSLDAMANMILGGEDREKDIGANKIKKQSDQLDEDAKAAAKARLTPYAQAFNNAFSQMLDTKKIKSLFSEVVQDFRQMVAEMIATAATAQVLKSLFGANTAKNAGFGDALKLGGAIPGLGLAFAGLSLASGLFGGHRARGGPVLPGRSYVVGERGPEMFTPRGAGSISPNGGMGDLHVHFHGATFANNFDVERVSNDIAYHLRQRQRVERTAG